MKDSPTIEVAAGVVFHGERLLITRRPASVHLGGLWEFPGGKREPDETWEQCLARELREELAIEVVVERLFDEIRHAYEDRTVHLKFFLCRWTSGEPTALGCDRFKWIEPSGLRDHAFPPADAALLSKLEKVAR